MKRNRKNTSKKSKISKVKKGKKVTNPEENTNKDNQIPLSPGLDLPVFEIHSSNDSKQVVVPKDFLKEVSNEEKVLTQQEGIYKEVDASDLQGNTPIDTIKTIDDLPQAFGRKEKKIPENPVSNRKNIDSLFLEGYLACFEYLGKDRVSTVLRIISEGSNPREELGKAIENFTRNQMGEIWGFKGGSLKFVFKHSPASEFPHPYPRTIHKNKTNKPPREV